MNQPIQNSVLLLIKSASTLPSSPSYDILKSYYLTKSRKLTLNGPVTLPQRFTRSTARCPRCCMQYEDGPASYAIQPERKKNRFVRRLLKKNANGGGLTRYQEIYMRKLTRKETADPHNTLVITCGTCKQDTKEILKKPDRQTKLEIVDETISDVTLSSKPRKKKKKKDRFSGLNQDVVLSLTPSTPNCKSLETPVLNTESVKNQRSAIGIPKKNLFSRQNNNNSKQDSGKITKKDVMKKQKNLKAIHNILNESKQKKSPAAKLQQFLTSL